MKLLEDLVQLNNEVTLDEVEIGLNFTQDKIACHCTGHS